MVEIEESVCGIVKSQCRHVMNKPGLQYKARVHSDADPELPESGLRSEFEHV